jgi:hypothetical protein
LAFDVWTLSKQVAAPTWADVKFLNKTVRKAKHAASAAIVIRRFEGTHVRVVAHADASFNRHTSSKPSHYGVLMGLSDYDVEFDQNFYTRNPEETEKLGKSRDPQWVNFTPAFWRTRQVMRRVDNIMEVETLSLQYASSKAYWLSGLVLELGLSDRRIPPVICGDNNSTISHIQSGNKHASNPRMAVIWRSLSEDHRRNIASFRWVETKINLADALTKAKTSVYNLLLQCFRLGKIFVARR